MVAELQIPAKANVYYAINTQHDLNFILREDKCADRDEDTSVPVGGAAGGVASSAGGGDVGSTPRGARKPNRDTSKARKKLLGLTL